MKDKYEFLLALKVLEYEIKELNVFARECSSCFELLQNKLDHLSQFITSEENEKQWSLWGNHCEIKEHSDKLREASVQALCDMEKYQSLRTYNKEGNISDYIEILSNAVKRELEHFAIDHTSNVLFIGAGAFPLTALTIAKEAGAHVMCLDNDLEAIDLAKQIASISGLESLVAFSNQNAKELAFTKEATHVMIASLVPNKLEVLEDLKEIVDYNTKIILRYGNGLKSMFNYPLEQDLSGDWVQTKVTQSPSRNIYDTMVLQRNAVLS